MKFLETLKKMPLFWRIFAGVGTGLVLLLVLGLSLLYGYLADFEAAQPIHPAEEIFQRYFQLGDYESAFTLAEYQVGEFETVSDAAAKLKEMKAGKNFAFYSVPCEEGKAIYNVVLVDPAKTSPAVTEEVVEEETSTEPVVQGIPSTKVAVIYLTQSTEESEWGFFPYEFERLEMVIRPTESVTVTAPSDSTVMLNGKPLGASHQTGEEAHAFNAFLPDGVPGIQMVTYTVEGLFFAPKTLTCTDANGQDQSLDRENGSGPYVASLNYSKELEEEHGAYFLTGMKEYAKHIQSDVSFSSVRPYFDPNSAFYWRIYENPGEFVIDHSSYTFENEYIGEFYAFDENTFCCHVSFDQVLHHWSRPDYTDPLNMVIFIRKVNGKFMIYDRFLTE